MKFKTYKLKEKFDNVRIYEVETIELPARTVLEGSFIDIEEAGKNFKKIAARAGEAADLPRLGPYFPLEFTYRDQNEKLKELEGLVVSEDRSSLISFALNRLEEVPEANRLTSILTGGEDPVQKSCEIQEFIKEIADSPNGKYKISPFLLLPPEKDDRRNYQRAFAEGEIEGENLFCIRRGGFLNSKKDLSAMNIDRAVRKEPTNESLFLISVERNIETEDGPEIPVRDYVCANLKHNNRAEDRCYRWVSEGERGKTKNVRNLPRGLLKKLDEKGKLKLSVPELWAPLSSQFLAPELVVGAAREQILEAEQSNPSLEEIVEDNPKLDGEGLERILVAVESRQFPLEQVAGKLQPVCEEEKAQDPRRKTKKTGKSRAPIPVIEDPRLAAYILLRTEDDVYDSQRPPGGINFRGDDFEDSWIVLANLGGGLGQ